MLNTTAAAMPVLDEGRNLNGFAAAQARITNEGEDAHQVSGSRDGHNAAQVFG